MRTGISDRRKLRVPDAEPANAGTALREIFLVESDIELRDILEFALSTSGYVVKTFDDGPPALEALLALPLQARRRLILLSIDLAGLDGHTLHEQLQAARPGRFMVVFLSVRDSDADHVRASSAGALDYLVKPVSVPVLLAKVKVWFESCERVA